MTQTVEGADANQKTRAIKFHLRADVTFYAENRNWALMRLAAHLYDLMDDKDLGCLRTEDDRFFNTGHFSIKAIDG